MNRIVLPERMVAAAHDWNNSVTRLSKPSGKEFLATGPLKRLLAVAAERGLPAVVSAETVAALEAHMREERCSKPAISIATARLRSYAHDRTQGPACAIAAGAGTIWRNYHVPVGDRIGQTADRQLDGLADLGDALARDMQAESGTLWRMRNGYALPERGALARIEAHLAGCSEAERDRLRGLLRVGLHQDVGVTEPGAATDAHVTQVYCSALPVAYSGIPEAESAGFASLILEAAYEATVLAAVLNAARGGSRRLLLTRIGGGAFGNDEAWISAAILRALRRVVNQGLEVLMVSYGPPSAAIRAVETAWYAQRSTT
jgi:hypothetical protein